MKNVLKLFNRFLLSFVVFCLLLDYGGSGKEEPFLFYSRGMIFLFMIFIFYFLSVKVKYFSLFLLSHGILVFCGAQAAGSQYMQMLFIVIGTVLALLSIHDRLYPVSGFHSDFIWFAVFGIVYLTGYWLDCRQSTVITSYSFILFTALNFIELLLGKQEQYLQSYKNRDNIPKEQVRSAGNFMTGIFLCILIPGLFLARMIHPDKIMDGLKQLVSSFLKWLFGLLPETGMISEEKTQMQNILGAMPLKKQPAWLKILSDILCWSILAGTVIAVVYIIFRRIYSLYRRFMETKQLDLDVAVDVMPDKTEKWGLGNKKKSRFSFLETPEDKIRRLYRKTVLSAAKDRGVEKGRLTNKTPAELSGSLKLSQYVEDENEFTGIYQKARYGQTSMTRDEVMKLKKNRK